MNLIVAAIFTLGVLQPESAPAWSYSLPTGHADIVKGFIRPAHRYAPGHRGTDWAAPPGTTVHALGDGYVTFVGRVGGVPTVSVDHGPLISSYQPVRATVAPGEDLDDGDQIGVVVTGVHCSSPCVHIGLRRKEWTISTPTVDPYVDPVAWLERRPVLKSTL